MKAADSHPWRGSCSCKCTARMGWDSTQRSRHQGVNSAADLAAGCSVLLVPACSDGPTKAVAASAAALVLKVATADPGWALPCAARRVR
jgi:hypothetical protein